MLKRVNFAQSRWLAYALIGPQIVITLVFFIWPASQALFQSFLVEDAFGLSREFVWLENFGELFADEHYLGSFRITIVFSAAVAILSMGAALLLAVMADRVIRGAMAYKSLLIWITFVASTHPVENLLTAPIPMWPGDRLWENYGLVLGAGIADAGGVPMSVMIVRCQINWAS